jgi:hypothetical protein
MNRYTRGITFWTVVRGGKQRKRAKTQRGNTNYIFNRIQRES